MEEVEDDGESKFDHDGNGEDEVEDYEGSEEISEDVRQMMQQMQQHHSPGTGSVGRGWGDAGDVDDDAETGSCLGDD